MIHRYGKFLVLLLVCNLSLVSASPTPLFAQSAAVAERELSRELIGKLPADLRDASRKHLRLRPEEQAR